MTVEEGPLKLQQNLFGNICIYTYTDAAKDAGPPELLANPTFTFMLETDEFDLEEFMTFLGETLEKFLDG